MIYKALKNVREKRPLIHNITNYVTAADCANITLAVGASPIMADAPMEVGEVTAIANGLVINTGTISEKRLEAMLLSGKTAKNKGIPIVLDPVGAGVSRFRTKAVKSVIEQVKPDVIRLNASELKSLCLDVKNTSGVDNIDVEDTESIIAHAKRLSYKTSAVIAVSGQTDVITDGIKTSIVRGGHEMMRLITGSGCMLSSVTGAFAAANTESIYEAVIAAFAVYGRCGKRAYRDGIGAASYKNNFFDEMTNPVLEGIEIEYR